MILDMDKIIWTKEWCLDGGDIDRQHKNLIDVLNRIIDRDININELLLELIEYASEHFVDEEVLMIKNDYPEDEYITHKNEHRFFTKALLEISFGLFSKVNPDELEEVIQKIEHFCFSWFNIHFLTIDKQLVEFLKSGGDNENIVCN